MKKALIAIAIAFIALGAASAQPFNRQNQVPYGMGQMNGPGAGRGFSFAQQTAPIVVEKVAVEGKLELVSGRVAIKQDAKTYFVMLPARLYGFIDGLKEGATVKIDGYAHAVPTLKDSFALRASTLTLNGKTYDLGQTAATVGPMGGGMMGGRKGNGMGNRW
jgi:hypothetical protein